ncbi:MAG TPA: DsbE family thiol:disulfide interchange protein [Steroidobacteraceae bacterium]|nr:DsbE family thiol:disulfide interchange protein [Steroidobacteraceae bacterium]
MNRFVLPVIIFLLLAGVLYVGVVHSPDKSTMVSALLGKPAPAFELRMLGDPARGTFSSQRFAGRPWVLNVWGTWCAACRDEHPVLLDIAKQNRLPIVGLDWRDDDEDAMRWLTQLGNPYTVVVVDSEGRTAIDFGVYGAPETFFIDAEGVVQYRHVGAMTMEVWEREFVGRIPHSVSP